MPSLQQQIQEEFKKEFFNKEPTLFMGDRMLDFISESIKRTIAACKEAVPGEKDLGWQCITEKDKQIKNEEKAFNYCRSITLKNLEALDQEV